MKNSLLSFLLVFTFFLLTNCSKDDDNTNSSNNSRVVKYEVTGNFTGTIAIVYTTQNGGATNGVITSLPWNNTITYDSSVATATFAMSGNGGTGGQTVTVKVFRGEELISTNSATANNINGSFTMGAPAIVF